MPIHPNARRCIHIKLNQKQCGSPALTGEPYCRLHHDVARRRRDVKIPSLQSAADVQQAITETIRAMLEGTVERRLGTATLFGLQLAQNMLRQNLNRVVTLTPAEAGRSIVSKIVEDTVAIQQAEVELDVQTAELEAEEKRAAAALLAEQERAAREAATEAARLAAEAATQAERAAAEQQRILAEKAKFDLVRFASYAERAAIHAEKKAIMATLKPTPWEVAVVEILKNGPREFVDSIPRDEFGEIRPNPEQQEELNRLAIELMDNPKRKQPTTTERTEQPERSLATTG